MAKEKYQLVKVYLSLIRTRGDVGVVYQVSNMPVLLVWNNNTLMIIFVCGVLALSQNPTLAAILAPNLTEFECEAVLSSGASHSTLGVEDGGKLGTTAICQQ